MRRQEVVEERKQCFRYGKEGHKKWECPKRNKRRKKEVAPPQKVWEKIKQHCEAKGLPPRGAVMSMEGWIMQWEVVTLVECGGCNYKGTKTQKNRGQGFLSREQLCNMWCGNCKEMWNWREEKAESGRAERVKCSACEGKNVVVKVSQTSFGHNSTDTCTIPTV